MDDWRRFFVTAYEQFHEEAESYRDSFPGLFPYDVYRAAAGVDGGLVWGWSVPSEIQETINGINAWGLHLHEWGVWLRLLGEYGEEERAKLEIRFVEPLAFFCMYQPQALAERLLEVAENAVHQANLAVYSEEIDRLDQDALPHGSRFGLKQRREQLDRISAHWSCYRQFRDLWTQINSKDYRRISRDFRNLSSHSIAPRFRTGIVSRVFRYIVPETTMVKQPDGTYRAVEDLDRLCVRYACDDVLPLLYEDVHAANLKEYTLVKQTMRAFAALIEEITVAISNKRPAA